jgi:hypothetical protein
VTSEVNPISFLSFSCLYYVVFLLTYMKTPHFRFSGASNANEIWVPCHTVVACVLILILLMECVCVCSMMWTSTTFLTSRAAAVACVLRYSSVLVLRTHRERVVSPNVFEQSMQLQHIDTTPTPYFGTLAIHIFYSIQSTNEKFHPFTAAVACVVSLSHIHI